MIIYFLLVCKIYFICASCLYLIGIALLLLALRTKVKFKGWSFEASLASVVQMTLYFFTAYITLIQ
jgi:hypothetical protein